MKPQADAKQHDDRRSGAHVALPAGVPAPFAPELNDEQRQILATLEMSDSGLTMKQLEARTAFPRSTVEDAVAVLVDQKLVSRLNTLIPSYVLRRPGPKALGR